MHCLRPCSTSSSGTLGYCVRNQTETEMLPLLPPGCYCCHCCHPAATDGVAQSAIRGGGIELAAHTSDKGKLDVGADFGYLRQITFAISNSRVENNTATEGGGVWSAWPVRIHNCSIRGNTATRAVSVSDGVVVMRGVGVGRCCAGECCEGFSHAVVAELHVQPVCVHSVCSLCAPVNWLGGCPVHAVVCCAGWRCVPANTTGQRSCHRRHPHHLHSHRPQHSLYGRRTVLRQLQRGGQSPEQHDTQQGTEDCG